MKPDPNNTLSAWKQFELTGKVSDYLHYCTLNGEEGKDNDADDGNRPCDRRKDSQQR